MPGLLNPGDPTQLFDTDISLGQGTYGEVFKATHKKSKKIVAMKVTERKDEMLDLEQEILILRSCAHRNIIGCFGCWYHEKHNRIWIALELAAGGSIADVMFAAEIKLNEQECQSILASLVSALEYLEKAHVLHRDIKNANLLLHETGVIKLADFGIAAVLTPKRPFRRTAIGAPYWMAPEVIHELEYDYKADIWSTGIVSIELAEGNPPNHTLHPMRALFMIPFNPSPKFKSPKEWSSDFNNFLARCVDKNPATRANCKELAHHSFIRHTMEELDKNNGKNNILIDLAKRAVPGIRRFRQESDAAPGTETAGIGTSFRDGASGVRGSTISDGRPQSQIFSSKAPFGISILDVDKSSSSSGSNLMNGGVRQSLSRSDRNLELVRKARTSRVATVDDVFALMGEQPLSAGERALSTRLEGHVMKQFMLETKDLPFEI
jgi:serine/threonine protein kinase